MASRTSASLGAMITMIIFITLTMVFLVASIFFYSEMSNAKGRVNELTESYEEIIATGERSWSNVDIALNSARSERKSLVDYLLTNNNELKQLAFGSPGMTMEQVAQRSEDLTDGSGSLASVITRLRADAENYRRDRDSAIARMNTEQTNLNAEYERIEEIEQNAKRTAAEATDRVDDYRLEVSGLRTQVEDFESRTSSEAARSRDQYRSNLRERDQRIGELNQQILVLRDQVRRLRGETDESRISPVDEYALVDGEIAAVQPGEGNEVVITLGREDKLVIGMTFSVFSNASSIRPNESGNYLPGKAVIEVIGIDASSARCRVIRASRGNPVVVGDVIANPVYDPTKTYNFVVYGNFDADGDGVATPYERAALVAVIERWGGEVIDDISGDLDFLVLGRRPEDPVQPAPNAPRAVYDNYLRLQNRVDRYEDLFEQATASSIPVLNENRLRTLIGEIPR